MRDLLGRMHRLCGALAGLCLLAMLAIILVNIAGGVFGFSFRGADAYAGYCLAASLMLGMSYTLGADEHIRVTLLLQRLKGAPRLVLELGCLVLATGLSGAVAWFALRMTWQSWRFHEVSVGADATALWIPQSVFAFGAVMLFAGFVERTVATLLRGPGAAGATAKADDPSFSE